VKFSLKNRNKPSVTLEDKCKILGQFWDEFKEDDGVTSDFIKSNDVGLPLAWFISIDVVKPLELGEVFINKTFSDFLDSMNLIESELVDVHNLDSLLELVDRKNQNGQ
jgi:hypothetical protein